MVNNNLYKVENTLRSIAKRYKSVKYSLGLAILFLMMGVSAFSEETVQEVPTSEQIALSKENLKNSVGNLQSKIDSAKAENEKKIKDLKLELTQLMEQGDQVVKSNWSSWQFGTGYTYNLFQIAMNSMVILQLGFLVPLIELTLISNHLIAYYSDFLNHLSLFEDCQQNFVFFLLILFLVL